VPPVSDRKGWTPEQEAEVEVLPSSTLSAGLFVPPAQDEAGPGYRP
jgi:hypothetical protein